jgi:hypothetical protein
MRKVKPSESKMAAIDVQWLIAFYIHTPPIEDIPNFSNPSLEFPGYLLHDTLEITYNTTHSLEFPGYLLPCTLEIWHNTTPPWNFQVISYIVPWKYGITHPLPGISRLSLTLYPGNMA